MKITLISDQENIDFLKQNTFLGAEFLCSAPWRVLFSEMETKKIVSDQGEILAVFNVLKKNLGGGRCYYYLPRGPLFSAQVLNHFEVWQYLAQEMKNDQAVFMRVEPLTISNEVKEKLPIRKSLDLQPAQTLILDLAPSLEDLKKTFHQKTRYNINLAVKKGVIIREARDEADFLSFWRLMTQTGERDSFRVHEQEHYKKLLAGDDGFVKLFLAELEGVVIAAGIFVFFGDKVTYLHGASDNKYRQVMAPYLLQWHLITLAHEGGFKYYDFFGIDENKWPGVTRFKLGFGGKRVNYAGTYDLVLNPYLYFMYHLLRKIKRLF